MYICNAVKELQLAKVPELATEILNVQVVTYHEKGTLMEDHISFLK